MTQDEIKKMLLANHNIILHGAPGTGKTYLAQKIAEKLGATFKMVQFHPSYDYTDFVEGLRPTGTDNNGNIIFSRQDGVFKEFCKKAINATLIESVSVKNDPNIVTEEELKKAWEDLLAEFENDTWVEIKLKSQGKTAPIKKNNNALVFIKNKNKEYDDNNNQEIATYRTFSKLFEKFDYKLDSIKNIKQDDLKNIVWCKPPANAIIKQLYNILVSNRTKEIAEGNPTSSITLNTPFIFLIDEINRGDMSKIFGELFYAIDPGYRGEDGKIDTQYQNLVPDGDDFKGGFYVPKNVYIIGTMNDIDRSVESMDFAMRRRFQFIEVTAEDRAEGMGLKTKTTETDAYKRMTNLNNCIISKEIGLSKAYQIGGSYFLSNEKDSEGNRVPIKDNFENLWKYKLEGLLREYLRGEEESVIDNKLNNILKPAFDCKNDHIYNEKGELDKTKNNNTEVKESGTSTEIDQKSSESSN